MNNKTIIGKKYEKELRANATKTEKQFRKLLNTTRKRYGLQFKFNFQKGWYKNEAFYISDFYFPGSKTTIELDGDSHLKFMQIKQDKRKEEYLTSQGIRTLRIPNRDVWHMDLHDTLMLLVRNKVI